MKKVFEIFVIIEFYIQIPVVFEVFDFNIIIFVIFVLQECKALSARVHQSSPDHQRIRRECHLLKTDSNPVDCEFRKIITDVDTRWNSTFFLLKSIFLLRPALESIRDGRFEDEKTNPDLKNKIPSERTFEIMSQVLPIMEKAETLSRLLSADQKPTICDVRFCNFRNIRVLRKIFEIFVVFEFYILISVIFVHYR